jgi:hypothetical protein
MACTGSDLPLVLDIHPELRFRLHLIPLLSLFPGVLGSSSFDIVEHGCVRPFDSFGSPVEIAVLDVSWVSGRIKAVNETRMRL